jgi:two-component system chemotaxis response regulator CheB
MGNKLNVLVVDDSALVRQTFIKILAENPEIGETIVAQDPFVAADKLKSFIPDVIILDIEMPKMDGLTFLKKIMEQRPIPVIICSSLTAKNSESAFKALEYGAIDIIEKPKIGTKVFLEESKTIIIDAVKSAARADIKRLRPVKQFKVEPKLSADAILPRYEKSSMMKTTEKIIMVGVSTGGTEALKLFLEAFPADSPGIVIVQHMPENFTKSFADRLNAICKITVKEAEDGETVIRGKALIAPGNKHMLVKRNGAMYYVEIKTGPLVSRHRPSVDVLFRSGAKYVGKNAIAIIMTGMGDDGAAGILEMKESGAFTIAQDEESCVVYGMPKAAVEKGAIQAVLPLQSICGYIFNRLL